MPTLAKLKDASGARVQSAEEHFRKAVVTSPRYVKGWINLAATLLLEAGYQDASDAAQHIIQLDSTNPQA
jgi:hypothetical protein